MTKTKAVEAAERLRKEFKGFNAEWFEADANSPDDAPRELTPWVILACATIGEEIDEDEDEE